MQIEAIDGGSLTSVTGFRASGIPCGLKPDGAADLALVCSDSPCAGAAMFTTNAFKAAPVLYDRAIVAAHPADLRAVVINSGCANACTGEGGLADTRATAVHAAELLDLLPEQVLVMSTGVIGLRLPMAKIEAGLDHAVDALSIDESGGHAASRAIMTTDTVPKTLARPRVTVAAMPGGSHCRHGQGRGYDPPQHGHHALRLWSPTLPLTPADGSRRHCKQAVDASLNRVTVDGDTSTNDTILLLASGQGGG